MVVVAKCRLPRIELALVSWYELWGLWDEVPEKQERVCPICVADDERRIDLTPDPNRNCFKLCKDICKVPGSGMEKGWNVQKSPYCVSRSRLAGCFLMEQTFSLLL